jgi:hypothetical protein
VILGLDRLAMHAEDAFLALNPADLAFMFASGKSEGYLRDVLGAHLSKQFDHSSFVHVTREWKKHDLAIMDERLPLLLIEGKSWISHDAYRKSKLLKDKKSILAGALRDAEKLISTAKRYPDVEIYLSTVIYGVDTGEISNPRDFNVAYGDSHQQGIKSAGSFEDLVSIGRSHASELFQAFGPLRRIPLIAGRYMGMQVEADFFLVQIVTPELISSRFDLAQQISRQIS